METRGRGSGRTTRATSLVNRRRQIPGLPPHEDDEPGSGSTDIPSSFKEGRSVLFETVPQQHVSDLQSSHASGSANVSRGDSRSTSPAVTNGMNNTDEKRTKCHCKRSQCLKLYCECFARRGYCIDCECVGCKNTADSAIREATIQQILARDPMAFFRGDDADSGVAQEKAHPKGCHCKKTGCLKKYCECFLNNVECGPQCKCVGCRNCGVNGTGGTSASEVAPASANMAQGQHTTSSTSKQRHRGPAHHQPVPSSITEDDLFISGTEPLGSRSSDASSTNSTTTTATASAYSAYGGGTSSIFGKPATGTASSLPPSYPFLSNVTPSSNLFNLIAAASGPPTSTPGYAGNTSLRSTPLTSKSHPTPSQSPSTNMSQLLTSIAGLSNPIRSISSPTNASLAALGQTGSTTHLTNHTLPSFSSSNVMSHSPSPLGSPLPNTNGGPGPTPTSIKGKPGEGSMAGTASGNTATSTSTSSTTRNPLLLATLTAAKTAGPSPASPLAGTGTPSTLNTSLPTSFGPSSFVSPGGPLGSSSNLTRSALRTNPTQPISSASTNRTAARNGTISPIAPPVSASALIFSANVPQSRRDGSLTPTSSASGSTPMNTSTHDTSTIKPRVPATGGNSGSNGASSSNGNTGVVGEYDSRNTVSRNSVSTEASSIVSLGAITSDHRVQGSDSETVESPVTNQETSAVTTHDEATLTKEKSGQFKAGTQDADPMQIGNKRKREKESDLSTASAPHTANKRLKIHQVSSAPPPPPPSTSTGSESGGTSLLHSIRLSPAAVHRALSEGSTRTPRNHVTSSTTAFLPSAGVVAAGTSHSGIKPHGLTHLITPSSTLSATVSAPSPTSINPVPATTLKLALPRDPIVSSPLLGATTSSHSDRDRSTMSMSSSSDTDASTTTASGILGSAVASSTSPTPLFQIARRVGKSPAATTVSTRAPGPFSTVVQQSTSLAIGAHASTLISPSAVQGSGNGPLSSGNFSLPSPGGKLVLLPSTVSATSGPPTTNSLDPTESPSSHPRPNSSALLPSEPSSKNGSASQGGYGLAPNLLGIGPHHLTNVLAASPPLTTHPRTGVLGTLGSPTSRSLGVGTGTQTTTTTAIGSGSTSTNVSPVILPLPNTSQSQSQGVSNLLNQPGQTSTVFHFNQIEK